MKSIAPICFKGGVAKTTTAVNLAAGIKLKNPTAQVLLVDTDPQASIKQHFGFKYQDHDDFAEFLFNGIELTKPFPQIRTDAGMVDVFITSKTLSRADAELSKDLRSSEVLKRRFKAAELDKKYDYVVFDTSPALGIVNINVMTFVDWIIIPFTLDAFSVSTIKAVAGQIEDILEAFDDGPKVLGLLPTRMDRRQSLELEVLEAIKKVYGEKYKIFAPIGVDSIVKRSQIKKRTIFEFNSRASGQYDSLTTDVLGLMNG